MVKHASRRLIAVASIAISALALAACSKDSPTPPGGNGQIGDPSPTAEASASAAPTDTASPTAPATSTSTSGGGGGGSAYPSNAKDYALEILKAIDVPNTGRIVDLSSLQLASSIADINLQDRNAQWTHVRCQGSGTSTCSFFNVVGNIATVSVDTAKLGKKEAVTFLEITADTFPTDVGSYIARFMNSDYPTQVAHSSAATTNAWNNLSQHPTVTFVGDPYPCQNGKTCVDNPHELAGGGPYPPIYHFIIDPGKISQGRAGGVLGILPPDNNSNGY